MSDTLNIPDKKRHYNRSVFTTVAPKYDFITRALSFGRDQAWKRQLIATLPDLPAPHCLDLACGTGDLTRMLAQSYPGGEVIGLDLTPSMLDLADELTECPRIRFVEGDLGATQLPDASADVITGGYALRNAPDLNQALREVFRVLKPGGTAAFLDFSKSHKPLAQSIPLGLLHIWGSFWGLVLHRDASVYRYIADSLRTFPDRVTLRRLIKENGFELLNAQSFYCGMLECLVIKKPKSLGSE